MSWERFGDRVERGPVSAMFALAGLLLIGSLIFVPLGCILGWFGEAADVSREELGPRTMLKRYTWFKDAAAAIDSRFSSIKIYEARMKRVEDNYKDVPRSKWARQDVDDYNLASMELAGMKAAYNSLAADYNAAMAKENWRFTNVGSLPQGADVPLPREFKLYLDK